VKALALALLVGVGFAAAGCGSGKKNDLSTQVAQNYSGDSTTVVTLGGPDLGSTTAGSAGHSITVAKTPTTIPNVKAGTWIACKSLPGIRLTAPATGTNVTGDSKGKEIRLKRLPNGSIRVACLAN
jgi:hypothetical protein